LGPFVFLYLLDGGPLHLPFSTPAVLVALLMCCLLIRENEEKKSLAVHVQEKKRRGEKRREEKKRRFKVLPSSLLSLLSSFLFFLNRLGIFSFICSALNLLFPFAVLDGHTVISVDWNGKRVVSVGIAVRWTRGRKREVNR
jgi:di/tricarboxylate transporter